MTREKVIALVQSKIDYYDSCMEGADADELMKCEFASGAMRGLFKELQKVYAEEHISEHRVDMELSETEACEQFNLIAVLIDDTEVVEEGSDICKGCALYANERCYKVDCMTNNVYFKEKV